MKHQTRGCNHSQGQGEETRVAAGAVPGALLRYVQGTAPADRTRGNLVRPCDTTSFPGRSFPLPRGHARSAHDAVNRLIGSNEYGWFQQDPSGAPINYGFSEQTGLDHREIIPDYTGSQQMTFDVQPSEMVTFDSGARSFGADLQGDFYIRQIRLVPHDQIHRVRQRNLGLYISATNNPNDYQEVPANQYQFTQNSDGSIEYFFATPIQAQYVKVKTDWDDRDFAAVMTDRYATFKNPADQLLQLVVYKTSQSQTFAYDKNGNRTELNMDGRASGLTYYKNANGGNLSLLAFDGTWYYKYDANGNLVLKAKALLADDPYNPGTGVWNTTCDTSQEYWTYDWDLLNRMTTAKHYLSGTTPTSTTSYVYDTSGLRVERTGSDGVTRYLYSTAGVLLQSQKTNGDRRTLAYLGSTILGWVDTSTGSAGVVSTRYYTATDQLGSVTAVMDVHGAILWNSEYTPFGQVAGVRGSFDFTGIYTGKDIDPDTGLYYYNARWYDAGLGRFINQDQAGQGMNWYSYCYNDPLDYIDPSGLWTFGFGIVIGFNGGQWGIGFGAALDLGDSGNGQAFGFNLSSIYNQDHSWTSSASIGAAAMVAPGVMIGGGVGYSYNTSNGSIAYASAWANAFGLGVEAGTVQAWDTSGRYLGGEVNADAYLGLPSAHVGVGYQGGWGEFSSGAYFTATAFGAGYNSLSGFGLSEYLGVSVGSNGPGVWSNIPSDTEDAIKATAAPFTAAGIVFGLSAVIYDQATRGQGSINWTDSGIEFVTDLDLHGAITLGSARVFGYIDPYTGKAMGPQSVVPAYDQKHYIVLGEHEAYHTLYQWNKYGMFFAISWVLQGGAVSTNAWEKAADEYARIDKKKK